MQPTTATPEPHAAAPRRVVGILLLYYPEYSLNAVDVFARFLKSLSGDYTMVIVNNGGLALPDRPDVAAVVAGENALREFSGWQAGLRRCREDGLAQGSELLVFANDTFCHHNKFGMFTRAAFRQSFASLMKQPGVPMMAGEKFFLGKPFALDGLPSDAWICTYLFAWNRSATAQMESLTPPLAMERFYAKDDRGEIVFSELVSENLSRHITSWLTGATQTSWKGVDATGARGLGKLQGKANSILCEKYLSAAAVSKGVGLVDVFGKAHLKRLRRIESLAEKIQRWFGRKKSDVYSK